MERPAAVLVVAQPDRQGQLGKTDRRRVALLRWFDRHVRLGEHEREAAARRAPKSASADTVCHASSRPRAAAGRGAAGACSIKHPDGSTNKLDLKSTNKLKILRSSLSSCVFRVRAPRWWRGGWLTWECGKRKKTRGANTNLRARARSAQQCRQGVLFAI